MLAYHWVVLFDFHFVRHGALVLSRSIKMAGVSTGNEFDFVTHDENPQVSGMTKVGLSITGD